MTRNAKLRQICRKYLQGLRHMANKHGLKSWLNQAIKDTKNPNCKPTELEVQILARCVDDERAKREEIPEILDKPYNQCFDDNDFEQIKKLPTQGIYSRVNAMLYAEKLKAKKMLKDLHN